MREEPLGDHPEISSRIPGKKRPRFGLCCVFSESGNLEYLGKRTPELRSQVFVDVGDKGAVVLCCCLIARGGLCSERSGWGPATEVAMNPAGPQRPARGYDRRRFWFHNLRSQRDGVVNIVSSRSIQVPSREVGSVYQCVGPACEVLSPKLLHGFGFGAVRLGVVTERALNEVLGLLLGVWDDGIGILL